MGLTGGPHRSPRGSPDRRTSSLAQTARGCGTDRRTSSLHSLALTLTYSIRYVYIVVLADHDTAMQRERASSVHPLQSASVPVPFVFLCTTQQHNKGEQVGFQENRQSASSNAEFLFRHLDWSRWNPIMGDELSMEGGSTETRHTVSLHVELARA